MDTPATLSNQTDPQHWNAELLDRLESIERKVNRFAPLLELGEALPNALVHAVDTAAGRLQGRGSSSENHVPGCRPSVSKGRLTGRRDPGDIDWTQARQTRAN